MLFNESDYVKNNFIIFGYDFNELDMILPFIDSVLTTNKDNVTLYTGLKDISGASYHLEYLRTRHHLEQKYFLEEQCFSKYKIVINVLGRIEQLQRKRKDPITTTIWTTPTGFNCQFFITTVFKILLDI